MKRNLSKVIEFTSSYDLVHDLIDSDFENTLKDKKLNLIEKMKRRYKLYLKRNIDVYETDHMLVNKPKTHPQSKLTVKSSPSSNKIGKLQKVFCVSQAPNNPRRKVQVYSKRTTFY